jgi:hypothetical protein
MREGRGEAQGSLGGRLLRLGARRRRGKWPRGGGGEEASWLGACGGGEGVAP